jgi:hypothetical protein
MSIARQERTEDARARMTAFADRLSLAAERLVAETAESVLVLAVLLAFLVSWMIFWAVSTAPIDAHIDAGEASVWAQHFAFGYKHPPITGWLFKLWFAVFPRERWASDLLTVTSDTVALAVSWRLLRDHLDKNRALLGLIALMLIPLYNVKAEVLNANTVQTPFWAATLLFYLRARRGFGIADAFLAGAFASLTMLGKYWAVFLFAGTAAAAFVGPGVRRFWRSPAPYVMAAGAIIVIAPHVLWFLNHRVSLKFAESVATAAPFDETLMKTVSYVVGAILYVSVPLIFLAALRPSRAAVADTIWPTDEIRRQAVVLLLVPLFLPALVNLIIPYRLTPDWTFPDWALLPLVLYGSPKVSVDARAMARAGLVGLGLVLAIVVASPAIAYVRLWGAHDQYRTHFRQVATFAESFAGAPIQLVWGSDDIVPGLTFYMPQARPLSAADENGTLLIVCVKSDVSCQQAAVVRAKAGGGRTTTATFVRSFLGLPGPPETFQITVVPAQALTPTAG